MKKQQQQPEHEPRFVRPLSDQPSPLLQKAFDALSGREFEPKWYSHNQVLALTQLEKHCIYIIEPFQGEAFHHLETLGCRVYGPSCILSCFEAEKPLPRQPYPLFCTSMRGLIVCFSNIESVERDRLMKMVNYMGGEVMKVLTEHVTHLVTNQVGSKKYIVATSNLKIPIMLPAWVEAVWKASSVGRIHGANDDFKKFSCKIFQGLNVCVSGLDSIERKRVQTAVEDNGGTYTGEMRRDRTTHLITTEPKGQKYSFAAKWKIYIVHPQWLHDSLHAGFCQDEALFVVDVNKTSTPTKSEQRLPSMSNVSSIMSYSMMNITAVNETMNNTTSNNSNTTSTNSGNKSNKNEENNNNNNNNNNENEGDGDQDVTVCFVKDCLEELELKSSDLLDGCKVFLSGFCGERLDKMRRFVNLAGGTRFNSVNSDVTHVIVNGKIDESLVDEIKSCNGSPHVVTLPWLVRSQKEGRLLPEEEFSCLKHLEAASPVIQKVKPQKRSQAPSNDNDETTLGVDNEMSDLLSQYITHNETTKMSQTLDQDETRLDDVTKADDITKVDDVTRLENDETLDDDTVLGKRSVIIVGFDDDVEKELAGMVVELGGRVVKLNERIVPYYAVVPPYGCTVNVSVNEVVTSLWLQRCHEEESRLNVDENILYKPLSVTESKPLVECVIAITGYSGVERELLLELCRNLGAEVQEIFCKKANKKTKASTHLLASVPDGLKSSKYEAAKKLNVPVVTKEWVVKCASTGVRQDEKLFEPKLEEVDNDEETEVTIKTVPPAAEKPEQRKVVENLRKSVSDEAKVTPTCKKASRIDELKEAEKSTPLGNKDLTKMTPNTALANIQFDMTDLLSEFETPASQKKHKRKSSLPLEDLYDHHIGIALRRFEHPEEFQSPAPESQSSQDSQDKPLKGVVVAVSKKMSEKQSAEYFNKVSDLGGDYRWVYDNSCTHYIYQGRSDNSKEYKMAKEKGKYIVSPYWLIMCEEQNSRVDEGLFPANFNPSMTLSVTTPRATPMTRRQARQTQVTDRSASPVLAARPSKPAEKDHTAVECAKPIVESPKKEVPEPKVDTEPVAEPKTPTKQDQGNSLEMQEVIQKELKDIMANSRSSSSNSAPRRTKPRRNANSDNQRSNRLTRTNSNTNFKDEEDMCSQQGDVTWDDPNSRKEREKFVDVLRKPYSPTQHCESQFSEPPKFVLHTKGAFAVPVPSPRFGKDDDKTPGTPEKPPPTPEAPSLIFPRPKMAVSAPSPQPIDPPSVPFEETVEPKILMSGMTQQEKDNYGALIESLGGTLLESGTFDSNCTHLVAGQPTRNEKCLASIASGKWILHKSWLEACREAGTFVKEEEHEWGSAGTLAVKNPQTVVKLSEAAHRWRVKLQRKRQGAFHDWKVIICAPKSRTGGFKRLLEAGGASVLSIRPPFSSSLNSATHAFMDLAKVDFDVDLDEFVRAGVPCYKPEFIAGFLTDEFIDTDSYVIPELSKEGGGKKRKSSGSSSEVAKKSKLH